MKGELVRGRRTNHVLVDHQVLGSVMWPCGSCLQETNHALLEGNLRMCGKCNEVVTHPVRRPRPR